MQTLTYINYLFGYVPVLRQDPVLYILCGSCFEIFIAKLLIPTFLTKNQSSEIFVNSNRMKEDMLDQFDKVSNV